MKYILLLLLTIVIKLSYSVDKSKISNNPAIKGKALLIYYYERTESNIIKDYKIHNKRYRYITYLPIPNPEFNIKTRTLDIEDIFEMTDISRIIFCGEGKALDITLPFHYKEVSLNSLTNDSTIRLTINNRNHMLAPGTVCIDSLNFKIKKGKRIIQQTKIIHIENHGLIYKKNIFDSRGIYRREMEEKRINDSIDERREKEELDKFSK